MLPAKEPAVIVVGSHIPGIFVQVHHVPKSGETVLGWNFNEAMDGGKGSNQAIAAAKLGVATSFVGFVGRDRLGLEAEQWMRDAGVDLKHLCFSEKNATGVGFIILDDDGVPAMVSSMGANEELDESHVERALRDLPSARVLLTQFEIRPEVALHAARVARQNKILTIVNPAPACNLPLSQLQVADILTPNETEAKFLLGDTSENDVDFGLLAQTLRTASGAGCVMITLGAKGIVGADQDGVWQVEAPHVSVVDTSGAGDEFCAALAVGIVNGKDHRSASAWACKAAALSVTRPGTIPAYPTYKEVEDFIRTL
jgi:ribokinase